MKNKNAIDPAEPVHLIPLEGCVVQWDTATQVNYATGEIFDFNGDKVYEPEPEPAETHKKRGSK